MKNITIAVPDCPMWGKMDVGVVLMLPDVLAKKAIKNGWGTKSSNPTLLLGERIRMAKERKWGN